MIGGLEASCEARSRVTPPEGSRGRALAFFHGSRSPLVTDARGAGRATLMPPPRVSHAGQPLVGALALRGQRSMVRPDVAVRRWPARPADSRPKGVDSMQPILANYFPVLVFIAISGAIATAMVGGSLLAAKQRPYAEKVSAYECGFEAFDDARRRFDVRYYLVAILFIIFDLEVAFLFPWAVSLSRIGMVGFWSMMAFLGVLTVGFIYEWRKGALEWE